MKIVFMGTPDIAIPVLEQIADADYGHEILSVYTQPDRKAGRGRKITTTPIKEYAISKKYKVLQPQNFKDPDSVSVLKGFNADIAVVAAYGIILPIQVLNLFRHGCINLHPSLLPKYRGPSPVASAILAGEGITGTTIIKLDSGMDSGSILDQKEMNILENEFCGELTARLFTLGSIMIPEIISKLENRGGASTFDQDHDKATFTEKLSRNDGLIDWTKGSDIIWKEIRAYNPWPGSHTKFKGKNLKIIESKISTEYKLPSGHVSIHRNEVYIGTGDGALNIKKLQADGGKIVLAADFTRGHKDFEHTILG